MSGTTNKKEEETAVATVGVTEESTSVLGTRSRTGSDPGGGIDLLAALQLHNTTRLGVTQVPGLVRLKPAYYLQGKCHVLSFYLLFFSKFSKYNFQINFLTNISLSKNYKKIKYHKRIFKIRIYINIFNFTKSNNISNVTSLPKIRHLHIKNYIHLNFI